MTDDRITRLTVTVEEGGWFDDEVRFQTTVTTTIPLGSRHDDPALRALVSRLVEQAIDWDTVEPAELEVLT